MCALIMPWGSLARWLAFRISPFPLRLTCHIHGISPCTLYNYDGRVSLPWPDWILCTIMRWRFLACTYYPFPEGLIRWNGGCLLILLFRASLGVELCFYSSTIGVLSNSQPCPPNRPILLVLLRIVFGGRKELTIVNIIDNKFSAVLPYVLFLTCRVVFW